MTTELGDAGKLMAELGLLSPDEIATKLIGLGIRGECEKPRRCAIAMYLEHMTGMMGDVGGYVWALWRSDAPLHEQITPVEQGDSPQSVVDFIREFDERAYPELIEGTVQP